jgi:ABC-type Fe3+ transport system permease subunit
MEKLTIRFIKDISGAHRKYCKCKFYPSQMSMNHFRRLFLSSIIEKTFTGLYIWVTRRVSYKKQKVLAIHQHMGSTPVSDGVRVAPFSFLCCVAFCVLFIVVMYLVYSMLPVPLDWPFLFAPSGFSNVYVHSYTIHIVFCVFYSWCW